MIDYKKLRKEFTELLHTFSADELQEWLDMDRKRMAQAELEKKTQLNGAIRRMPKMPRAANGRFASKKVMAPANHATAKVVTVAKAQKKKAVSV
jgi:hypothetical protein